MKPLILSFTCAAFLATGFIACNNDHTDTTTIEQRTDSNTTVNSPAPAQDEATIKAFLYDTDGTYGWETTADKISYDFFQDGRLHIQGPDGEATMWEGTWELKGNQLTLNNTTTKEVKTVTVRKDGEKLFLNDVEYTRYKAQ